MFTLAPRCVNVVEIIVSCESPYIIIIIINLTADRPCGHAVLMPNIHAGKPGRSKNPRLDLLYTRYSRPTACSNYLAPAVPTSLDWEPSLNLGGPHYLAASS